MLRVLQQACSSPRNECRSAVRIKVLDVLSFVLLINRQFYEVCTRSKPRGVVGVGLAGVLPPLGLVHAPAELRAAWGPTGFPLWHAFSCLSSSLYIQ